MGRLAVLAIVANLVAAGCSSSGCASAGGARHQATRGVLVAHATLAVLQDGEMELVCGRATAPSAPACVPLDTHKKVSGYLAEAFEYDKKVAEIVRDLPEGQITPVQVLTLVGKIGSLVTKVLELIPDSPQRAQLAARVGAK